MQNLRRKKKFLVNPFVVRLRSDSNCINGTVPGRGTLEKAKTRKKKRKARRGKGKKKEGKKGRGGLRGEKKRERERGGRIEFDANR